MGLIQTAIYAQIINEENVCTWGISNNVLSIPTESIVTDAILTLHNVSKLRDDPETAAFLQLLDNPDLDIKELEDNQKGNYFEGYGILLRQIDTSELTDMSQDITIDLNQINDTHSWVWDIFDTAPAVTLNDSTTIAYSSSMLTLLDYAGTGRSFGFGLDCDGLSVDAMSLDITVQSTTEATPPMVFNFVVGNPNNNPVFNPIANSTITETETLIFTVSATDPDGDSLEIDALGMPSSAEFINHTFTWTPTDQQAGIYHLLFVVVDGQGGLDFQAVKITVNDLQQWTSLAYDGFETGWGSYSSGGLDCSLYTGTNYAHQGDNAANIQDDDITSSLYLTNGINISEYSEVKIEFWYMPYSMDSSAEGFRLDYWDGSQWITINNWKEGIDFQNEQFYFESLALSKLDYHFSSDMRIRFVCDASSNYDDIFIDDINILAK